MKALLISVDDVKRYSSISGSLDADKVVTYIETAQDIHVQNYLGTDLYDAIQNHIINETLPVDYELLIDNYIKPMLIRWTLVEYMPFASYTIANNGVFKHSSEASQTPSKEEIDALILKTEKVALHYTKRLVEHLCDNQSKYPEYNTNTDSDMYPSRNIQYGGIYLEN